MLQADVLFQENLKPSTGTCICWPTRRGWVSSGTIPQIISRKIKFLTYVTIVSSRPQSTHRVATATFLRFSTMREKLAQPGEGGDARPPPFTISILTYKVVVYAAAERADTLLLFLLFP